MAASSASSDRVGRRREQAAASGNKRVLVVGTIVLCVFGCGIALTLAHLPSERLNAADSGLRSLSAFPGEATMVLPLNLSAFCSPWPKCALPVREPAYHSLCSVLSAWSPDDSRFESYERKSPVGQLGKDPLPVFSFMDPAELAVARAYREAEVPFLLRNVPDLDATRREWTDSYLRKAFGEMEEESRPKYKIERSTRRGHFLYYKGSKNTRLRGGEKWTAPQDNVRDMTYSEFEATATDADAAADGGDRRLYLTISAGMGGVLNWVVDSLRFFRDDHDFFRVNYPEPFHGINCRFGMRGVVQAAHYDHGRNFIAMVRGHKRYVILPPRSCDSLELLDRTHPSARHASFDWADPGELRKRAAGPFCAARATEVVLTEGQVMYLPSFWFHYIVSLDRTVQCNSRAGSSDDGEAEITACMAAATNGVGNGY